MEKGKTFSTRTLKLSDEDQLEVQRWIESRRRNFPSRKHIEDKARDQEKRQELGIQGINEDKPVLSKIEVKLRRRLKLISTQLNDFNGIRFLKNRQHDAEDQDRKQKNRRKVKNPKAAEEGKNPEEPHLKKREVKFQDKQEAEQVHSGKFFRYRRNELFDELVRQE